MEQKKNLEESGLPTSPSPTSDTLPSTTTATPSASPTTSGDDETYISEEQLREMSLHDLVQLCKDNEIPITGDQLLGGKPVILKYLLDTFGA